MRISKKHLLGIAVMTIATYLYQGHMTYPFIGVIAFGLFGYMAMEDFETNLVDLYLIIPLFILLGISSATWLYILGTIFMLLIMRMIYIVSSLVHVNDIAKETHYYCKNENGYYYDAGNPKELNFLPSFAIAIIIYGLLPSLDLINEVTSIWNILYEWKGDIIYIFPLTMLAGIWFILEISYYITRKQKPDLDSGIGMGDVLVLPSWAGFLGIVPFSLVLLFSMLIHIVRFAIKSHV